MIQYLHSYSKEKFISDSYFHHLNRGEIWHPETRFLSSLFLPICAGLAEASPEVIVPYILSSTNVTSDEVSDLLLWDQWQNITSTTVTLQREGLYGDTSTDAVITFLDGFYTAALKVSKALQKNKPQLQQLLEGNYEEDPADVVNIGDEELMESISHLYGKLSLAIHALDQLALQLDHNVDSDIVKFMKLLVAWRDCFTKHQQKRTNQRTRRDILGFRVPEHIRWPFRTWSILSK